MDRNNRLGICSKWVLNLIGLIAFGALPIHSRLHAETDPKWYAVMASAQVQTSPAQITLNWLADANATGYTISRRQGNSWALVATLGGSANSWADTSVQVGTPYEYRLQKTTSVGYPGGGYVYAGINAPLKESRGKLVLIVDNTYASALDAELQRLEWDLAGDGWTVHRPEVSQ